MFTKRKLAKLMEKNEDNKQEINYEILHKAKEESGWNNDGNVKVIDNNKQKLIIIATILCLSLLLIFGIYLGVTLSKPKNGSLDLPIHYSYNENNIYKYKSVEKYMTDNNVDFLYLKDYQNIDEKVIIYKDGDIDVLLSQDIVLLDTFETIEINVQLKSNYIFDFLYEYDSLNNKITINNIQISFNTTFDEEMFLYETLVKFTYKDRVYRVCFKMEGEADWQEEINKLLA